MYRYAVVEFSPEASFNVFIQIVFFCFRVTYIDGFSTFKDSGNLLMLSLGSEALSYVISRELASCLQTATHQSHTLPARNLRLLIVNGI